MSAVASLEKTEEKVLQEIIAIVTAHTGISADLLNKRTRKAPVPYTKQLIAWCAVKTIGINVTSRTLIANLGWKDHSGPVTAFKKIKGFLNIGDQKVVNDIDIILAQIKKNRFLNCKN
jgi:hypothetical protein